MSATPDDLSTAESLRSGPTVRALGRFVFRFRDYLVPIGLAAALALTRPEHLFGSAAVNRWADLLGFMVAALGQTLRILVIGYAYIQRGGANKRLAAPKLVCEGFYGHSRNPMYVGNILLFIGLAIIYNSRWIYVLGLPVVIAGILSIVRAEEDFLASKFGAEYADYCRRVNRFVPSLRGLRATMQSMRFDWRRVLRKEYGTTFAWLSAAFFLLAWERLIHFGYAASAPQIHALLIAYVPVVIGYATIRWLKKTRRLES